MASKKKILKWRKRREIRQRKYDKDHAIFMQGCIQTDSNPSELIAAAVKRLRQAKTLEDFENGD